MNATTSIAENSVQLCIFGYSLSVLKREIYTFFIVCLRKADLIKNTHKRQILFIIMLNINMLIINMLTVIMLSAIMLSVVVPYCLPKVLRFFLMLHLNTPARKLRLRMTTKRRGL